MLSKLSALSSQLGHIGKFWLFQMEEFSQFSLDSERNLSDFRKFLGSGDFI
jgi:hypothetical protein